MNKCKLHYFRSVGKFFVFFEHEIVKRRRNVALAYNVLRLCVCLPLAQRFKFTTNVDGANSTKPLLWAVRFI
jgi:hypothetical protein